MKSPSPISSVGLMSPGPDCGLSVVYYLRRGDRAIKIGWSTFLQQRMKQLRRQHGPLDLMAWEPGGRPLERQRHAEFESARIDFRYEWFRATAELNDYICQIQDELREATEVFGTQMAKRLRVPWPEPGYA